MFLQAAIQGQTSQDVVMLPEDVRYESARLAWNRAVDQHPAAIVLARSTEDIVAGVRYALQKNLSIAVQATGHGVRRPADGAVLINTSQMNEVVVNAQSRTAWVAAGAKWGDVLQKAQAVGLAPLLGSSTDVGAVGYTLGGGLGWLGRKYGLSADHVRRFEVVTADGEVRQVCSVQHPDLFWGLRGGGGSLAIVTGMEIDLFPVTTVYAGNLVYPAILSKAVMKRYREWIKNVPIELTTSVAMMNYPPLPELPEFLRGQSVIMVRGCYVGPVAEGEALIQEWLEWQQPIANLWGAMPFAQADTISSDPVEPMPTLTTGGWIQELTDEAIDTLVRYGVNLHGSSPLMMTELRHAGGAIRNVTGALSPIGHRDAEHVLLAVAAAPSEEYKRHVTQHMTDLKAKLSPVLAGEYMNFLDIDESQQLTKNAYSLENYHWLMRLKAKYDPKNRLNHGFNIPAAR